MNLASLLNIASTQLGLLLNKSCEIQRETYAKGDRGAEIKTPRSVEFNVPCAIQPRGATKPPLSQSRDGQDATHTVYLGSRTYAIDNTYLIVYGSRTFKVLEALNIAESNVLWALLVRESR